MLREDFNVFKQRYLTNCKTQSDNPAVLILYSLLLEREHWDSDYWDEDYGANDIIYLLQQHFAMDDWKALELDLANWTTFQLELFTQAILSGYHGYTENGVYYSHYDIDGITSTIPNRLNLMLPLIAIEREKVMQYHNLSSIIIENINFINDHFDILLNKDNKHLQTIQTIVGLLAIKELQNPVVLALLHKIEKAS